MRENQINKVQECPSDKFTWKIEKFSKLKDNPHFSQIFLACSYKWKLMIYPKGLNKGRNFAIFIQPVDLSNLLWGEINLRVINQTNDNKTIKKALQHHFAAGELGWGCQSILSLSNLYHRTDGYIVNDTCIIEAEFVVCKTLKKINPAAEKELPSMTIKREIKQEPGIKSLATIPNEAIVSKLTETTRKITTLSEYPGAGQIFEEGQHGQLNGMSIATNSKFEDVGGFSVLKTQAPLYKQIWLKYGHIATSQVLTDLYQAQVVVISKLMTCIMEMHQQCLNETSSEMIEQWESKIIVAEKLGFNVKWLRQHIEDVKKDFYGRQRVKTAILEQDQAKERLNEANQKLLLADNEMKKAKEKYDLAYDEMKKAKEDLSALETRINPLLSESEMYVEKGNRLLFDGLL